MLNNIVGLLGTGVSSFGGYMFAILALIFFYIAAQAVIPEYVPGLALVTVVGIVLFRMKGNAPTPPGSQPQQHGNF